jgi:hypothetical protein
MKIKWVTIRKMPDHLAGLYIRGLPEMGPYTQKNVEELLTKGKTSRKDIEPAGSGTVRTTIEILKR